mgnify:CR=1 FL=1
MKQMPVESYAADFTDPEDYRGINAAMHTVEAYLATADVTGDLTWADAVADGRVTASGERSDLSELLPLPGPRRTVRTARGTGARPADGEAPDVDGSAPDRGEPTAEGTR